MKVNARSLPDSLNVSVSTNVSKVLKCVISRDLPIKRAINKIFMVFNTIIGLVLSLYMELIHIKFIECFFLIKKLSSTTHQG